MSEVDPLVPAAGRRAIVVGGGGRALGPVSHLLRERARVEVVAPQVEAAIEDLVARGTVAWRQRAYRVEDLDHADVVVAATGSAADDEAILADARARHLPTLPAHAPHRRSPHPPQPGRVVLVGGGPGDPGLLTVRGRAELATADVVVVDRLAPLAVLDELGADVEIVDVSKIPRGRHTSQERINEILIDRARAGRRVVRLKGGDPYVFGRGMEEVLACEAAGVCVDVVPGVTSAVAGPGLAGVPLTHRGVVQGFAVVSGHAAPDDPRSTVDWRHLAASGVTIVILMGVETLPTIARAVLDGGGDPQTPVACVMDAALPSQRTVTTSLSDLVGGPPQGLSAPAVTVIGDVAAFAGLRSGDE